jgi:hypothetical protein
LSHFIIPKPFPTFCGREPVIALNHFLSSHQPTRRCGPTTTRDHHHGRHDKLQPCCRSVQQSKRRACLSVFPCRCDTRSYDSRKEHQDATLAPKPTVTMSQRTSSANRLMVWEGSMAESISYEMTESPFRPPEPPDEPLKEGAEPAHLCRHNTHTYTHTPTYTHLDMHTHTNSLLATTRQRTRYALLCIPSSDHGACFYAH